MKFLTKFWVESLINQSKGALALLPFAIILVKLPFWAKIKNLRTHLCKPHKLGISSCINMILSDLERYAKGLPEYVKI